MAWSRIGWLKAGIAWARGEKFAAINKLDLGDRITHLSTGGGASLEYVQGLPLPGVTALERKA